MRKLFALVAALVGTLAIAVAPGSAITGNFVEDFEHPYVGLVVFYDAEGEFLWRCSGSLLTPTVFLTAGHCTDQGAEESPVTARVYFQQDAGANYDPETELDPITGYPEFCAAGTLGVTCATSDQLYDFGFDNFAGFPDIQDVGLVILDQPITVSEYGQLAEAGFLESTLADPRGREDITFTLSGYGLTFTNPAKTVSFRSRLMAQAQLVNLNESRNTAGFNLALSGDRGGGRGGSCFGDSGGPVFYGAFSSNIIVGVTSWGFGFNRQTCGGPGFAFRTDTEAVIEWILETVEESGTAYTDIDFVEATP
jgi:Trypsin